MIGSFNIVGLFHTLSEIFLSLTVILLVASVVIFIYVKHLLRTWRREQKPHEAITPALPGPSERTAASAEEIPGMATGLAKEWADIKANSESVRESEWKMSVIEADKLVDDVLKSMGYGGESMGERLLLMKPDELTSIQDLWDAHKLRNIIVHDTNYRVSHEQVMQAMHSFERVLHELGRI